MDNDKRILQIIPANGWFMKSEISFVVDKTYSDILCWALCENEEGKTFVTGMFFDHTNSGPALSLCADVKSFEKYTSVKKWLNGDEH